MSQEEKGEPLLGHHVLVVGGRVGQAEISPRLQTVADV